VPRHGARPLDARSPAPASPGPRPLLVASWLGRIEYRAAWALQKRLVAARSAGMIPDTLLLLEHPAVLTLGRGADPGHVLATPAELTRRGIDVIPVERGGEVTYHGPGQLVAYPIVRLADRHLLVRPFVRALEAALVATCAASGVVAERWENHPGCWCEPAGANPRKIGALGLRIERGVSYHGIALNIDPDLGDFELIDACGLPGVKSTSIAAELGRLTEAPSTDAVERAGRQFALALADSLAGTLEWSEHPLLRAPDEAEPVWAGTAGR
jgi:lipoyl(octanoyl) transferase